MVTVEWTPERGWHDARIKPYGPLTLDPATAVLHYAQETFEGMKAYRHPDGSVWTFRPEENAKRMARSSAPAGLPGADPDDFVAAVDALVERRPALGARQPRRGEKSLYLRPFMFASEVFLGVRPAQHVTFMVIASPGRRLLQGRRQAGHPLADRGLHPRRPRRHGRGQDRRQLRRSLVAQQQATAQGCDQVVFLDAQEGRYVEELGGMNLYFVHADGRIVTPAHRHDPRGHHPRLDHRAGRQARPPGRGAQVLHRRVARRRRQRRHRRDLRVRHRRGGHARSGR